MVVFLNEIKLAKKTFIIWTSAIVIFMMMCIFLYPSMKNQMTDISEAFKQMGTFSQAFGLDKISFGSLMGYYGIECGNVLGLGGALFAALIGISALAKEEKEHTAEFLLTHPVSRTKVVTSKLIAIFTQIIVLNLIVTIISLLSILIINEKPNYQQFFLLHLAYTLMQIEIAGIAFGISSMIKKGSLGIGLGIAIVMYFINIIANLMDSLNWVKYLTPFGYCDGADIIVDNSLSFSYILVGYVVMIIMIVIAYIYYNKKDITA